MVNQANNRLNDREKHIEYLEEVIKSQKINTETENNAFQKIIENLKQELSNDKMLYKEKEQALKE